MRFIFTKGFFLGLIIIVVAGFLFFAWSAGWLEVSQDQVESATVERMDIEDTVSASARVNAKKITRLGFPVSGVIQNIYKEEGEMVEEGEIIATLTNGVLVAEYDSALQQVKFFQEEKNKVTRGPVNEVRKVARSKVLLAEAELEKVKQEYDQAIKNARKTLLTSGLVAYPVAVEYNNDVPPTISGNYNCTEEGEYRLEIFSSQARSGRSYRLTGMATGTFEANAINPEPLGQCGLYIQFDDTENYRSSEWVINIPNKRSSGYTALENNLRFLEAEANASIKLAEEAVLLAEEEEQQITAPATTEELAQAEANLDEALAKLLVQEAWIEDKTIRSPFSGVVSKVDMKIGESASQDHTVTIINEGDYDLVARIPEIDIKKVTSGNLVEVAFDADNDTNYQGEVAFVSPVSVEVGGGSYYEAYIQLEDEPTWLREGLNADVKFTVGSRKDVLAVPKRFVIEEGGQSFVLINNGGDVLERKPVVVKASGDGLVEISGIEIGSKIYLP